LPTVAINVVLTLLLIYLWIKSTISAIKIFKNEKKKEEDALIGIAADPNTKSMLSSDPNSSEPYAKNTEEEERNNVLGQSRDSMGLPVAELGDPDLMKLKSLIK
jgi:hypothetical protein